LHKEEGDVLEDSHDSVRNEISTNIAQLWGRGHEDHKRDMGKIP
jgi:hypothetical protein